MIVYKMTFPCGRFYIGYTTSKLEDRLKGHFTGVGKVKTEVINEYGIKNYEELLKLTEVVYTGWDAYFVEKEMIHDNRENELMINERIRSNKPNRRDWIQDAMEDIDYISIPFSKISRLKLKTIAFLEDRSVKCVIREMVLDQIEGRLK